VQISNKDEIIKNLKRGTVQVTPENEFIKKIESGKKLKIKLGVDPTAPDLHLGHSIVLNKLKQFQDLGHEIIFLIGDFTARIGDPTGRSKTRPPLSEEEIKQNAQTYLDQVYKILSKEKTTIRFNSEWLSKISLTEMIKIAGKITVARIIERDDFQTRINEKLSIGFHELFYPLLQGYDSVELKADVEIGGTDQTFNLLMGRHLQEQFEQEPQVVMTMPLLEGLDGIKKMSKSLGNYVGIQEDADQAYGKLMSISDELMWRYFQMILAKTEDDIFQLKGLVDCGKVHPMDLKKDLSEKIVSQFWSSDDAKSAKLSFESLFQKKDYSKATEIDIMANIQNPVWIVDLLKKLKAISSSSEGKRLIQSKAISINDEIITDFKANIDCQVGMTVKAGKHKIYKIK
jgi:tyrosyl-tRNA synthetase